ncbi:MAG: hypothetical protein V4515_12835 [Chloroflexota bacterium]
MTDPIRRPIETVVAQDPDGVWRQREVTPVARFRLRVLSDRSKIRSHQGGSGEDFELVVDTHLEAWVRRFGTDTALRRDEDALGVALVVVEDVTAGIRHDLTFPSRPSDPLVRWSCTCGAGSRGWLESPVAQQQGEAHVREVTERDLACVRLAQRRREERAKDP